MRRATFWCGGLDGGIVRVNPSTGAQTVVSSNDRFLDPQSVAIAPVLSVSDVTITEGTGGARDATFTVTLAPYTSQIVSVGFATGQVTATAAADYLTRSGTVTFNPGERTKTVTITVISDDEVEATEAFTLQLQNPLAAVLERLQATGTILDDDPTAYIAANDDGRPDKKDDKETEEERQQRERTNRSGMDQYRTEGNVIAVEKAADGKSQLVTIAMTRLETLVIVVPCFGDGSCYDIRPSDYLEADGEQGGKEELGRFIAEEVTILRNGRRVR